VHESHISRFCFFNNLGLTQKQLLIESRTSIISGCLAGRCTRGSGHSSKP
jgi:hypothetical protein